MTNKQFTKTTSFRQWLADITVEIPLLQRDYAQGRNDEKTKAIRKGFVEDLVQAINGGKKIHLDFIYGPTTDSVFHPLDGQQRLTTLFLLHWYLANKTGNLANAIFLKNFRYKVRTTSQEFIDALLIPKNFQDTELDKKGLLDALLIPENLQDTELDKKGLLDAKWYYSAWDYDPTVQGMLNMIDELNKQLKEKDHAKLWSSLIDGENSPITFTVLDMKEFKLGDELYMRMNARGLPLSDFENFKAWLHGKLEQTEIKNSEVSYFNPLSIDGELNKTNWGYKIDTEWSDLIWTPPAENNKEAKDEIFDARFMRLFNRLGAVFAVSSLKQGNKESEQDWKKREGQTQGTITKMLSDEPVIPEYYPKESFTEQSLSQIFNFIDWISHNEDGAKKLSIGFTGKELYSFKKLISKSSVVDARTVTILTYAIIRFRIKSEETTNSEEFKQWIRVIRNLVENTIINTDQLFVNAIHSIDQLFDASSGNILTYLAKYDSQNPPKLSTFTVQIKEECEKAKLIQSDPDKWESEIISIEDHPMLRGKVKFLLTDDHSDGSSHLEIAKNRFKLTKILWNEKESTVDTSGDFLLFRALISNDCNYEFWCQRKLFARNWKENFEDKDLAESIRTLLDNLKNIPSSVEEIQKYLKSKIENYPDNNDWKWHIVKHGHILLKHSRDKKIQRFYMGGIFVFEKNNAGNDIAISPPAYPRNALIFNLLNKGFKLDWEGRTSNNELREKGYILGHNIVLKYMDTDWQVKLFSSECKIEIFEKDKSAPTTLKCSSYTDENLAEKIIKTKEVLLI